MCSPHIDPHTQSLLAKAASENLYTVIVEKNFKSSKRCWEKNKYMPKTFKFPPERRTGAYHEQNTLPDTQQKIKFVCGSVFENLKKDLKDLTREYIVVVHDDNSAEVKKEHPELCVVTYDQFQNMVEILNGRPIDQKIKHEESVAQAASGKTNEEGPQEPSPSGKRPRSPRYGRKEVQLETGINWMMSTINTNYFKQSRLNLLQKSNCLLAYTSW